VARVVERVVDDELPGALRGPEVLVGQPAGVADVAEHQPDVAHRAAPHPPVGVAAEHVLGAEVGQPERLGDQPLDEVALASGVVLAAGAVDDRLVVDVGQLQRDLRVAGIGLDLDLGHLRRPLPHLGQHDRGLTVGQRGADRPVVQRRQPSGGQGLERGHVRCHGAEQQGLGEPQVGVQRGRTRGARVGQVGRGEAVLLEDQRLQALLIQGAGRPEQRRGRLVERLVAGRPSHQMVERIPDRDDVVDAQGVAAVDQDLLHHLQGGAFTLHHPGQRPQGRNQRGRERVGEPELGGVGALVRRVGVDAVEQHVPRLGPPVQPRERLVDLGGRGVVPRGKQPLVGDVGQVVVAEGDLAEPPLLEVE